MFESKVSNYVEPVKPLPVPDKHCCRLLLLLLSYGVHDPVAKWIDQRGAAVVLGELWSISQQATAELCEQQKLWEWRGQAAGRTSTAAAVATCTELQAHGCMEAALTLEQQVRHDTETFKACCDESKLTGMHHVQHRPAHHDVQFNSSISNSNACQPGLGALGYAIRPVAK